MSTIEGAIYGPKSVERIFGAPPIAEIPLVTTKADVSKSRNMKILLLVLIPLLVIAGLTFINYFIRPLDVLWYVIARRLGL